MKLFVALAVLVAVAFASGDRSYYDPEPVDVTFPAQTPPLGLFKCADTAVVGCGYGTSCESQVDACNRATKASLVQMVQFCAKLKAKGGTICVPNHGDVDAALQPTCSKSEQVLEHVYYCTDGNAYQCSAYCDGSCFELTPTMTIVSGP